MKRDGNRNRTTSLLVCGIVIAAALFVVGRMRIAENGGDASSYSMQIVQNEGYSDGILEDLPETSDLQPEAESEGTDGFEQTSLSESIPESVEAILEGAQSAEWVETPQQQLYTFRNERLLDQHYEKHGIEMGFATVEEYVAAANAVINHPDVLHKQEAEDNDDVYFLEATNEFVVVSTDGYIRTYFIASGGIDYYNRQ